MDAIQNKKGSGFSKPCAISPQLQELVGVPEMARTEVCYDVEAICLMLSSVYDIGSCDFIGCQKNVGLHPGEEFAKSKG